MARNKYVKDYRLLETFDEKGRVHTDTEYIGDAYRFHAPSEAVKKAKLLSGAACILGWAFFLGGMMPASTGMHTPYVSLPYAFLAVPLFLLGELIITTFRVKDPMEHRFADKLNNRFPPVCLAMAVLSAAALIGEAANLLRGFTLMPGDTLFVVCAVGIFLCGCLAFSRRNDLSAVKK